MNGRDETLKKTYNYPTNFIPALRKARIGSKKLNFFKSTNGIIEIVRQLPGKIKRR
jgi:hypothetical protein